MIDAARLHARLNEPGKCVLPRMLEHQAALHPDRSCCVFEEWPSWTYGDTLTEAQLTAAALADLGICKGSRVLVMLDNGPDIVRISLGLYFLGAILMPVNTDLSEDLLARTITYGQSALLIAADAYAARVLGTSAKTPEMIAFIGDEGCAPAQTADRKDILKDRQLRAETPIGPDQLPHIDPWDIHTIFFTSGTTGVSKGVECSHVHTATMAIDGIRLLTKDDTFCAPCGYYHIAGAYVPWATFNVGAAMLISKRFSATKFWEQVRRNEVTGALLVGVMCDFLLKLPPNAEDSDNPLRFVIQQPLISSAQTFRKRFGVEIYTQYDQTETSPPITSDLIADGDEIVAGYCGRLRDGFEVRIVDEQDREVPKGHVGELVVRCDVPWVIAARYFDMPDATAKAWRNGWHHTGDMFRQDEEDRFYYVDRSKDVIRRRGENISSFEIERELSEHPSIAAAAAYAVPHPDFEGESEVMVAIEPEANAKIDPAEIIGFLETRLSRHMLPTYIRTVAQLPRNTTNKIVKTVLAEEAVTSDCWQRGITEPQEVL